jgi:hypothetical protein
MLTMLYVLCMMMLAIAFWKLFTYEMKAAQRKILEADPRVCNFNHLIDSVKILEKDLEKYVGARGRNLNEKITSIECLIPEYLKQRIIHINFIRNKVIHEKGFEISNPGEFITTVHEVINEIRSLDGTQQLDAFSLGLNTTPKMEMPR